MSLPFQLPERLPDLPKSAREGGDLDHVYSLRRVEDSEAIRGAVPAMRTHSA